jgi:hypothetical protein
VEVIVSVIWRLALKVTNLENINCTITALKSAKYFDRMLFSQRNLYGSHPFYLAMENSSMSHGFYLQNANAMGTAGKSEIWTSHL